MKTAGVKAQASPSGGGINGDPWQTQRGAWGALSAKCLVAPFDRQNSVGVTDINGHKLTLNPDDKNEQACEMHGRVGKCELEEPRKIGLIVVHRSGCNQLNSSGRVPEVFQELDLTIHAVESITRISDE